MIRRMRRELKLVAHVNHGAFRTATAMMKMVEERQQCERSHSQDNQQCGFHRRRSLSWWLSDAFNVMP